VDVYLFRTSSPPHGTQKGHPARGRQLVGYIAKSSGPQDVLSVLLRNLGMQELQSRICSAVAIAIVAETCGPFMCIPAILNEYRTAELNVQMGCLKAFSFAFEYYALGRSWNTSYTTSTRS